MMRRHANVPVRRVHGEKMKAQVAQTQPMVF